MGNPKIILNKDYNTLYKLIIMEYSTINYKEHMLFRCITCDSNTHSRGCPIPVLLLDHRRSTGPPRQVLSPLGRRRTDRSSLTRYQLVNASGL
jgi:hypothetical protein